MRNGFSRFHSSVPKALAFRRGWFTFCVSVASLCGIESFLPHALRSLPAFVREPIAPLIVLTLLHQQGPRLGPAVADMQANVFAASTTCSSLICGSLPPKPLHLLGRKYIAIRDASLSIRSLPCGSGSRRSSQRRPPYD